LLRGIRKAVDIIEGHLAPPTELAAEAAEAVKKTYEKNDRYTHAS